MKKALKKAVLFLLLTPVFSWGQSTSFETSESCACTVDTLGLSVYLETLTLTEDAPLSFEVEGPTATFAVLHGYIDGSTPAVVADFITAYPEVTTLVFIKMPGSADDEANLEASLALHEEGYTFYLPAVNAYDDDAFIASGAVDMFLAGKKRVIDVDAEVGVHSWSDGVNEATDYPEGSPEHQPYIDYYVSVGFSEADAAAFYYFTIEAAPAAGIHLMTEAEIETYKLRTCTYATSPAYSVLVTGNLLSANLPDATYQWVDCENDNAPITGATEQMFLAEFNGVYAVEITEESCAGISECIAINSVSIDEQVRGELLITPNPAIDHILIQGVSVEPNDLQVFDLTGKAVQHNLRVEKVGEGMLKLDVSTWSNGMYVLKARDVTGYFIIQ